VIATDNQTVADMVVEDFARAAVFEKHQIDYCCNGKRTLQEVCEQKGLSVAQLTAELDEVHGSPDTSDTREWSQAPLAKLAKHIVDRHHSYLRTTLPSIAQKLEKVGQAHGANHGPMLAKVAHEYRGLVAELVPHMQKEEMILFPAIERLEEAQKRGTPPPPAPGGTLNNPIRMMEHEHDSVGVVLKVIREVTGDYTLPADACVTFGALYAQLEELETDLHHHIHLENNILFPRAAELEGQLVGR
jgi:regulator of cell morphogenesis and NO signaling